MGLPMKKIREVWVVVADGAKARFYATNDDVSALRPVGPAIAVSAAAKLRSRELKSDRPGRSVSSSRTGIRHAIEPKHDFHKMEKHRFTLAVSKHLERALSRGAFDDLVIVAPRRSLGELRILLPSQVRARVQAEVAKDLTRQPAELVWEQLAATVTPLCTQRRRKVQAA
jgi:protein required for attachment to host cells